MRKIALSLFVIAASGAYVWHQRAGGDPLLDVGLQDQADATAPAALAVKPRMAVSIEAPTALPKPAPVAPSAPETPPVSVAANTLQPVDPPLLAPADPLPQPVDPAPVAAIVPSVVPVPIPTPRPAPAPPVVQVKNDPPPLPKGQYRDGTYPGPTVDAYYGWLQVQAVVQGGKLVSVDVLQYPADRRTSRAINHQALPMLEKEVLQAQSARVDIVSGATLTSSAYRRSLGRALAAAS